MKKTFCIFLALLFILSVTVACDVIYAAMHLADEYAETAETYPDYTEEDYDDLECDEEEEKPPYYEEEYYCEEYYYEEEQEVLYGETKICLSSQDITNERLAEMVRTGEIPENVTHLNLAVNNVSDISSLSNLTYLADLNLWGNRVTDLSPLSNLTNLTQLNLWGNQFSDLSPVGNLTNLASLAVGDNLYFNGDLSALRNLTNLTSLGLGDTWEGRMDFTPIEVLVNLRSLQLWGASNLSDLSIFNNLRNLQRLIIHASSVTDFSPIANLINLESLDLQQNQIRDVSHINFERLTNLTELFLWHNQISDVSSLMGLTGLRTLQLDGNNLTPEQIAEIRIAIPGSELDAIELTIGEEGGSIVIELEG